MTALHPSPQATVPALPSAVADAPKARSRREKTSLWDGPPHGSAQLGAAIVAVACALFSVNLAVLGFVWAALPMAVLTLGILVGAFLPDVLDSRWARQDAAAEEQA